MGELSYPAVLCPTHGEVRLSQGEYEKQMSDPDSLWLCPICGVTSAWAGVGEEYE